MSLIKPSTEEALRDLVETNRTDKAITQALRPCFILMKRRYIVVNCDCMCANVWIWTRPAWLKSVL